MYGFDEFDSALLDAPDLDDGYRCAVCGRPGNNLHHVIEKGIGGVTKEVERHIPRIRLCGSGTTGCHGEVHAKRLHIYRDERGWVCYRTEEPTSDFRCWMDHSEDYRPIGG